MPQDRNLLLVKGNKATALVVRSQGLSNEENYLSRESRWLKAIVIADIDCTPNRLKSNELQIGSEGDLELHFNEIHNQICFQTIYPMVKLKLLGYTHAERQRQQQRPMLVNGDTWEWIWDQFSSVTIDQHRPLPLALGVGVTLIL